MRPDFVKEEHLVYLDDLKDSGGTNMFGAAPYLQKIFGVEKLTARKILTYWMETFGNSER